jgi:hypothetical protein
MRRCGVGRRQRCYQSAAGARDSQHHTPHDCCRSKLFQVQRSQTTQIPLLEAPSTCSGAARPAGNTSHHASILLRPREIQAIPMAASSRQSPRSIAVPAASPSPMQLTTLCDQFHPSTAVMGMLGSRPSRPAAHSQRKARCRRPRLVSCSSRVLGTSRQSAPHAHRHQAVRVWHQPHSSPFTLTLLEACLVAGLRRCPREMLIHRLPQKLQRHPSRLEQPRFPAMTRRFLGRVQTSQLATLLSRLCKSLCRRRCCSSLALLPRRSPVPSGDRHVP